MIATLMLCLGSVLGTCANCAAAGRDVKLCEPHAVAERSVLAREASRLLSKDPTVRVVALAEVAKLTDEHANAPSLRVAQTLAKALEDDAPDVRAKAAEWLSAPQHASASLEALIAALARTPKAQSALNAEHDALTKKLEGKLTDDRRKALDADRKACDERRKELAQWRTTLVQRLASFPDDRAVSAILAHTKRNLFHPEDVELVRCGSRAAVRALIESLTNAERDIVEAEKQVAEHEARLGGGQRVLGDLLPGMALEKMKENHAAARQALAKAFAERGFTPPDAGAALSEWRSWIETLLPKLPEKLPGITGAAW